MVDKLGGVLSSAVVDALKGSVAEGKTHAVEKGGFSEAIAKALEAASTSSAKADDFNKRLQMDDPSASVEETVIAMNSSSLQFTAVVQARNKILQAYNDIMNMPV